MKLLSQKRMVVWLIPLIMAAFAVGIFDYYLGQKQNEQAIAAMSWVVAGRTFVVDPGHGGEDPGKVSPSGIYEKDINLSVAKKLAVLLNEGGGQVILTREDDVSLSNHENTVRERKRADLKNRMELASNSGADLYIALHCNSFPQGKWYGAQTFYAPSVRGSKELAAFVQEELVSYLGNTTRKPKTDTTSVIFQEARIPIVNVEMGFLSNSREEKLLQESAYQDKIAWAVYAGVVRYLVEYGDSFKPTMKYISK